MAKKKIKRPQQYKKPKDPTFKEWWAVQTDKTKQNIKYAAYGVAVVLLLIIVWYYAIFDDGSLKVKKDAIVGIQDNWLVAELDGGKNSDYYHIANVDVPAGYKLSEESMGAASASSLRTDFTFEPEAESDIFGVYVAPVAKAVDDMITSVHSSFAGMVAEDGFIGDITVDGDAKYFSYQDAYEEETETGEVSTHYAQSMVYYMPSKVKDVCVLISVSVRPETADGYVDESVLLEAARNAAASIEMIEK